MQAAMAIECPLPFPTPYRLGWIVVTVQGSWPEKWNAQMELVIQGSMNMEKTKLGSQGAIVSRMGLRSW